jgi:hypothetical protein
LKRTLSNKTTIDPKEQEIMEKSNKADAEETKKLDRLKEEKRKTTGFRRLMPY